LTKKLFVIDWFPGWTSDDGKFLEESAVLTKATEKCVEMRSAFPGLELSLKGQETRSPRSFGSPLESLYWTRADCGNINWFICEKITKINNQGESYFFLANSIEKAVFMFNNHFS